MPSKTRRSDHRCLQQREQNGDIVKRYIHARLGRKDRTLLDRLRRATGKPETALVSEGLRLLRERERQASRSVLDVAGQMAGRYRGGPVDLSSNRRNLDDCGR
jgi:hypothetical protein